MPTTFFISDLHLTANEPETAEAFFSFIRDVAPQAQAIYVLGDLFEYWIGDDDLDAPFHQAVVNAFADIANQGIALFFMHGNRDFLLGGKFCNACHGRLLADPTLIDLYGTPTLLMHGDTLCTDDIEYIRFRVLVRDPTWQRNFLAKPLTERKALVEDLRKQSEQQKLLKSAAIMDVAPATVEATLRSYRYPRLIHGHTHRPAKHVEVVDGHDCERGVLTDWCGKRGGYLSVTPAGCETHYW